MASTIDSSTLEIRISEEITINGKKKGSSSLQKISGINEVSERIITALVTGTDIIALGAAAGAGTFIRSDVKYIRIKNLDNANFVRLAIRTDDTDVHLKLPALSNFVIHNGSAASSELDDNTVAFANITSIKAWADTASVDLDLFIASV